MSRRVTEWSPAEDLRPASGAKKPAHAGPVKVWYQLTYFEWDGLPSYTQLVIREDGERTTVDHGRIWPSMNEDEDGA